MLRLEIINQMLSALSYERVNSLNDNEEVVAADALLKRVSKQVQAKGWSFNTDNISLVHDQFGQIRLPNNALDIDPVSNQYVRRGGKLYDKKNLTFNIGKPIRVRMVIELNIEDIPDRVVQYLADTATLEFIQNYSAEQNIIQSWRERVYLSRVQALDYERDQKNASMTHSNLVNKVFNI